VLHQFRYLGRILDNGDNDDDDHAEDRQLERARATKRGRIGRILSTRGANPRTMGYFYKVILLCNLYSYDCGTIDALPGNQDWIHVLIGVCGCRLVCDVPVSPKHFFVSYIVF